MCIDVARDNNIYKKKQSLSLVYGRMEALLLLLTLSSVPSMVLGAVEPCSLLVIKSQNECSVRANMTIGCCDVWCMMDNCEITTYYMSCTLKYVQVSKCCEGYGGDDCRPLCDMECGSRKECSAPDTCTCVDGWTGQDCEQVSGLEAVDADSNSVFLSWDVPADASNINSYYIYAETDDHTINTTVYDLVNETSLDGLEVYRSYSVCIVPLLFEGNGTENCITLQTGESEPSSPPMGITVSGVTSTAVIVQWSPPLQPNGIITGYTLYINYTNSSGIKTISVDSVFSLFFINDLAENQNIGVSISASTMIGSGPRSAYVYNQTTGVQQSNGNTSIASPIVTFSAQSDNVLLLSWVPSPSSTEDVLFYVLDVSEATKTSKLFQWALRSDQSFNYTLNLDQHIPYELKAFVRTKTLEFSLLYNMNFFVNQGVPIGHPSNFSAIRLTEDSIKVSWHPMTLHEARGFIINYTVQYSRGTSSCGYSYNREEITTLDSVIVLNGIAIDSIYCVSVFASTISGNGPPSPLLLVPMNEYTSISLYLLGVNHNFCDDLMRNTSCSESRLTEVRRRLIEVLNRNCSCITSDSYFFDEQFKCTQKEVNYTANIIGTQSTQSSVLAEIINQWSNHDPEIVISGMALQVSKETEEESDNSETCPSEDNTNVAVIVVLVILLVLALFGWALSCSVLLLRHKEGNKINELVSQSDTMLETTKT